MLLGAFFHSFNPYLVQFGPSLGVAYYGLSYVLGFLLAWVSMWWLARRGLILIPSYRVPDAILMLVLGTLLGGRLGYALVYDPALFINFRADAPFWDLLAINRGGMASHGGMVGVTLACWRISRGWTDPDDPSRRVGVAPMLHVMDVVALVSPLGLFFGRCANFINGELLGRVYSGAGETAPWWTVRFPQELRGWRLLPDASARAPGAADLVRDAASHTPALSSAQLDALWRLVNGAPVNTTGLTDAGAFRAKLDFVLAHAARYQQELTPLLTARHASQLYQALAEGVVLLLGVALIWARARKPGVVAAWWLIIYGVLRVVTEFWRLPDPQFVTTGRILGLSRGQWLSVGMVAIGVALLVWTARRAVPKLGGWWAGETPSTSDTPGTRSASEPRA
jgi:phosphatidylglycerol:prolipoprotein diacylglycerol transferase